jgi:hypothetical protein
MSVAFEIAPESSPNILRASFNGARSTDEGETQNNSSTTSSQSDSIHTIGSDQGANGYATEVKADTSHQRSQSAKTYKEFYGLSNDPLFSSEESELNASERKVMEKENNELKKQVYALKKGLFEDLSQSQTISKAMFSKIPTSVQVRIIILLTLDQYEFTLPIQKKVGY